ncbi:RING finger and CHY zinc finger domain-containing protein 1 isoform X2 [Hydra vulgaris]|uniref:RING finger and CHY zinc finger domain-containing protein 1 isoform X2 n=1 Tax=Hydra vulgaris TaxID=6087 RepID=A0ABM4C7P8_HYDVU
MISEDNQNSCKHYEKKCSLLTPCCSKQYSCRICHDEAEDHILNRSTVEQIVCSQCHVQQEVKKNCSNCGILFGKYFCLKCRLFDDNDKKQFHCDGCGICRIGGRENFFHCNKCGMCMGINIMDSHKCLENVSHRNCPVCLEDVHTSRKAIHVPPCTHLLHSSCMDGMFKHGLNTCPVCNQSLVDMKSYWLLLDNEIAHTIMPPIYQNYKVNILCRDCHEKSNVSFHVIGLKCKECGGYNTTRIGGDDPLPEETAASQIVYEASQSEVSELEESWETISGEEDESDSRSNLTDPSSNQILFTESLDNSYTIIGQNPLNQNPPE